MKHYRFLIIILALLFGSLSMKAQDLTNYNLYVQNSYLHNPAYTVGNSKMNVFLNSHLQWMGFDGAPRVNTFGIHGPVFGNSALGLTVLSNQSGVFQQIGFKLNYGYMVHFSDTRKLRLGAHIGFNNDAIGNLSEQVNMTDVTLDDQNTKMNSFSSGFGFAYFLDDFEIAASMPQLSNRKEFNPYTIGMLAYTLETGSSVDLKPSVLMRAFGPTPAQFDINTTAIFQNTVWVQAGYRTSKSILFGAGMNMKGFDLAYIYQMDNGELSKMSNNTHEIQLMFGFGEGLFMDKSIPLSGKVTDKHGKIIPAEITVSKAGEIEHSGTTDEAGMYSFKLKQENDYSVTAKADGYYSYMKSVSVPEDSEPITQDFMLLSKNGKLSGTINRTDNKKGIPAQIQITKDGAKVAELVSDANGAFEIELKNDAEYQVTASADSYKSESASVSLDKGQENAQVTVSLLPEIKISGTVSDKKTGEAMNASLRIKEGSKVISQKEVNKTYELTLPKDGTYVLEFSADGYFKQNKRQQLLTFTTDTKKVDVALEPISKGEAIEIGNIEFKSGTAELSGVSFATLDKLYKIMSENPDLNVQIDGHTDSDGSASTNMEISEARAKACADYLTKKGIDSARISSKGYGEAKPLVPNNSPANKAKNRRVEFSFVD